MRIGLTGGIAAGKSTVADCFRQLGIAVIDADQAARAVVAPGQTGLARLVETFGPDILKADGHLDRGKLRDINFANPDTRKTIETLLHPLILAYMEQQAASRDSAYQVWEVPLLIEAGWQTHVDRVLLVEAEPALRAARLRSRDGLDTAEFARIQAAQSDDAQRREHADDVIVNEGDINALCKKVREIHIKYTLLCQST